LPAVQGPPGRRRRRASQATCSEEAMIVASNLS
jgi:hypothetical protein